MATRMQQRRGTAAQWTSANPILNAGEIGFESDNNKFKIGDGVNHWADLNYFVDGAELSNIIDGAPALLDTLNELAAAIGDDPAFITTVATNLSNHASDTTSVHGISDTAELATKTFAAELLTNATKSNITITGDKNGLTISAENGVADSTTDNLTEGSTNKYFTDERAQDAVGNSVGTGLSYDDASGAISVTANTYDAYGAASAAASGILDGATFTGALEVSDATESSSTTTGAIKTAGGLGVVKNAYIGGDLTISGDFTVNGTTTTVSTQDLVVQDPLIYIGENNTANSVDLGIIGSYDDGTYQHTGLVRDASTNTWKLFKGVTDEPTTTVNFAQGSLDDLAVAGITASSITVGDVSNTEFGYLNGVTSAIQTQLDAKIGNSVVDAKGDILIGTADNTVSRLAAGTNGYFLKANSSVTEGLEWAAISGYEAPTLGSTSIASGATVTTIAGLTLSDATLTGSLTANSSTGTSGQVLSSTGTGVQWVTPSGGAAFSELMLIGA